jgi:hypothetical protein
MFFKKLFQGLAVLAALLLSACATPGPAEKYTVTMPQGKKKATIVAHARPMPSWAYATDKLKLDFIVKGDVTNDQLAAIAAAEDGCRWYAGKVHPSTLVSVMTNGVIYAAAGYIGVGLGAKQAFDRVSMSDYGTYGGFATGASGAVNGIVTLGGKNYSFQNCGRELMAAFPEFGARVLINGTYP